MATNEEPAAYETVVREHGKRCQVAFNFSVANLQVVLIFEWFRRVYDSLDIIYKSSEKSIELLRLEFSFRHHAPLILQGS